MVRAQQSALEKEGVSHNLLGQRLGRKGRDTRDRIIAATEKLLAQPSGSQISLSAVAREASLGMTTLYLYFTDLPELLIAVLGPIMETAEDSYVRHLRGRWPDETLGKHCLRFVEAYHAFWVRHARILHLRNHYADNNDERMRVCRMAGSRTVIDLFVEQMDAVDTVRQPAARDMAAVLLTGIERMVTVATDPNFRSLMAEEDTTLHVRNLLLAEARLLELAVRDARETVRRAIAQA